jgi:hypothetical protein
MANEQQLNHDNEGRLLGAEGAPIELISAMNYA